MVISARVCNCTGCQISRGEIEGNTLTPCTINIERAWLILRARGVSDQTIQTVCAINGYSLDSLQDILYALIGYRKFSQLTTEV